MYLYYRYKDNSENKTIIKKVEQQKNKRDEKRLEFMIKYYCKEKYNADNSQIAEIVNNIKNNYKKFDRYIFCINESHLDMIDTLIKEIMK